MNEHINKELDPVIEEIFNINPHHSKFVKVKNELTNVLFKSAQYNGYRFTLEMLSTKMKKINEVPISDKKNIDIIITFTSKYNRPNFNHF